MLDYPSLWETAKARSQEYRAAQPFQFAVFDDFLPQPVIDTLCAYSDDNKWKLIDNPHTFNRVVVGSTANGKAWPEAVEAIFNQFMSARFLRFMEHLTGIEGLISDPYYAEAGFYAMREGGYLDIHADFSHHDKLGLERRANMLVYLNEDWKPEYKGDLILYGDDLEPAQRIAPIKNRCVVFEASERSFHGNPEPLTPPAGRTRKAVSMWYYTIPTGRPKHRAIFPQDPTFIHIPKETHA